MGISRRVAVFTGKGKNVIIPDCSFTTWGELKNELSKRGALSDNVDFVVKEGRLQLVDDTSVLPTGNFTLLYVARKMKSGARPAKKDGAGQLTQEEVDAVLNHLELPLTGDKRRRIRRHFAKTNQEPTVEELRDLIGKTPAKTTEEPATVESAKAEIADDEAKRKAEKKAKKAAKKAKKEAKRKKAEAKEKAKAEAIAKAEAEAAAACPEEVDPRIAGTFETISSEFSEKEDISVEEAKELVTSIFAKVKVEGEDSQEVITKAKEGISTILDSLVDEFKGCKEEAASIKKSIERR